MSSKDDGIRDISSKLEQVDLRGGLRQQQTTVPEAPASAERVNLEWEFLPKPPFVTSLYGSSAVCGNKAYFSDRIQFVYEYNQETKQWCEMTKHPIVSFTLVCVDDTLTSVGGFDSRWLRDSYINQVYSLIDRKWVNHFPAMRHKRAWPVAVYAD